MRFSERKTLDETRRTSDGLRRSEWRGRDEAVKYLLAKVTGNTAISGANYRWEYDWERAEITGSRVFQSRPSEPWYKGKALNITEGGNTATDIMPGYLVANIPAGFTVKPIATGTFVLVFAQRDNDGTLRWCFACNNAIDGTC